MPSAHHQINVVLRRSLFLLFFDGIFEPLVLLVNAEHGFFVSFGRRAIVLGLEFFLESLQRVLDDLLLSLESIQLQVRNFFSLWRNGLEDLGRLIAALTETTGQVTHLSLSSVAVLAEDVIAPIALGHRGTGVVLDL